MGATQVVMIHFETSGINLGGDLRSERTSGDLKSGVWNLVKEMVGPAAFDKCILANTIPFSAAHDAGSNGTLLNDVPQDALVIMQEYNLASVVLYGAVERLVILGNLVRNTSKEPFMLSPHALYYLNNMNAISHSVGAMQ